MDTTATLSSIGLPIAAAALGSIATASGIESRWYRRLDKPAIQPPPIVFPVAWTGLYASIGAASLLAQSEMDEEQAATYRRKLALNMALNAGWCWSFFRGQQLAPSVAVAAALALSSADLAKTAATGSPVAGRTLIPYALWTSFATVLSTAIWRRNR